MKTVKIGEMPEKKSRRKFDETFKRDAVTLWVNSGKSAGEVAADLGIAENRLYSWKRQFAPSTGFAPGQVETELAALRRENAYLREQRDILKKTLGILSEPPKSVSHGSTR
jgi:transposase